MCSYVAVNLLGLLISLFSENNNKTELKKRKFYDWIGRLTFVVGLFLGSLLNESVFVRHPVILDNKHV